MHRPEPAEISDKSRPISFLIKLPAGAFYLRSLGLGRVLCRTGELLQFAPKTHETINYLFFICNVKPRRKTLQLRFSRGVCPLELQTSYLLAFAFHMNGVRQDAPSRSNKAACNCERVFVVGSSMSAGAARFVLVVLLFSVDDDYVSVLVGCVGVCCLHFAAVYIFYHCLMRTRARLELFEAADGA